MTDLYRITDTPASPPAAVSRKGIVRPVLWLLLVISAAGNIVTSNVNVFVSAAFGLATLGLGIALAVQHYRNRRR
ncbi:MAG TPA: hypothetical protein VGD53_12250 [Actinoallomurus sp.]|jgi:hypothetical protein